MDQRLSVTPEIAVTEVVSQDDDEVRFLPRVQRPGSDRGEGDQKGERVQRAHEPEAFHGDLSEHPGGVIGCPGDAPTHGATVNAPETGDARMHLSRAYSRAGSTLARWELGIEHHSKF